MKIAMKNIRALCLVTFLSLTSGGYFPKV